MPYGESYDRNIGAWITEEAGEFRLHVLVEDPRKAFQFKISLATLARLNVESAAKLLTRVQNAEAYVKTADGSLMIVGPK